jgi:hypothetical protein
LIDEGHWKESAGVITAPEFDFRAKMPKLIEQIEDGGGDIELQRIVAKVWADIEARCLVKRKKRYV